MAFPFSGGVEYNTASPAGSDDPKAGDNRIREVKSATQQLLDVDHQFGLTGTNVSADDSGKHKKVTLIEVAAPTPVDNYGHIYAMDVSGVTELFYVGGTGTPKQLTSGGKINNVAADLALAALLAGDQTFSGLNTFSALTTFSTIPELPASDPTTDNQAARKYYVDAQIAAFLQSVSVNYVTGTSDISTTNTSYVLISEMTYTDTFVACNAKIEFEASITQNASVGSLFLSIMVDDAEVEFIGTYGWASGTNLYRLSTVQALSAASHKIEVWWKVSAGTASQTASTYGNRKLIITRGLA